MAITPQQELKNQQDYCNITQWHNAGFKGNNVTIWNCDGGWDILM